MKGDDSSLKGNDTEKVNSMKNGSTSGSPSSEYETYFQNQVSNQKYKNYVLKEEDLFPNQDLISNLFGTKPSHITAIVKSNIKLKNDNFKENPVEFKKESRIQTKKIEISQRIDKRRKILKKLRRTIIKNIKSKRLTPEPEDLDFLKIFPNSTSYINENSNELVFLEWKYKNRNEIKLNKFDRELIESSEINVSECIICMNEFSNDSEILLIRQCNHVFHRKCIYNWLKFHHICPVDKNKIDESIITNEF